MPVHLYGQPADLDADAEVARRHGSASSRTPRRPTAPLQGRRAGGAGDAAAWSFYPGKNLGAFGDARRGHDRRRRSLAERVRMLRNYGSRAKYVHEVRGFNCRLDQLQAAVCG